jgi:phosphoglycerate dehydrogenase-like enzyme
MSDPVVLVTGFRGGELPAVVSTADLRYAPDADTLAETLPGADVMFCWGPGGPWLQAAWDRADSLRWIQSASDGVDGVLFPELVASDVVLTNAGGIFEEPIAEWAIGAIVAVRTGLHRSIIDTAAGIWDDDRTRPMVAGSRLVVVGAGPIGRATARRALALGMTVTLVGRSGRNDPEFGWIEPVDRLREVLARADHVLDALPLTPGTERLFDAAAFAAMPAGAVFLNVGRGGTVDDAALRDALQGGRLAAAALDVFDEEPLPPDSQWWSTPNVIVSPHVCGDIDGWQALVVDLFLDNLDRYRLGRPLRNVVDKRAGFPTG